MWSKERLIFSQDKMIMDKLILFVLLFAIVENGHGIEIDGQVFNKMVNTIKNMQGGLDDIKQDFAVLQQQVSKLEVDQQRLEESTLSPIRALRQKIAGVEMDQLQTAATLKNFIQSSNLAATEQEYAVVQLEQNDEDINKIITKVKDVCCAASSSETSPLNDDPNELKAADCSELLRNGERSDGVYTIYANDKPIQVYCDMSGGGWTIIQKRFDGKENFERIFEDYRRGFGSHYKEHWLGLDKIHHLTQHGYWDMQVEIKSFEDETAGTLYSDVSFGPAPDFTVSYGSCDGTAGCQILLQGTKFSTSDTDQDDSRGENCADRFWGAWWYGSCHLHVNLNGYWYGGPSKMGFYSRDEGKGWNGLKSSSMKLRLRET